MMNTENTTLFISDLHLSPAEPRITQTFLTFLKTAAARADALYILGDFFEMHIGDDDQSQFMQTIVRALSDFTKSGPPTYFMRGNRDFLIGKKFIEKTGMILLEDPTCIQLYNQKIILMHGDTLCTRDLAHQRFRFWVTKKWVQFIFLHLPLFIRQKIADKIRKKSMESNAMTKLEMMDVVDDAVIDVMKKNNARMLIHGHTHQPNTHLLSVNGAMTKRIVLDAWHKHGQYLQVFPDGKMESINISH